MKAQAIATATGTSILAVQVLDTLADGLRSGAHEVRSYALMPLGSTELRLEIVRNPRLSDRIDARLFGSESWVMPDHLDDFPQAQTLINVLKYGPAQVFRGLGFAWHANRVAVALLSGSKDASDRLTREELRQVLAYRGLGNPDANGPIPGNAEIERDGSICLWSWMAALPNRISPLGLAILLKHCQVHGDYRRLSEGAQARRVGLADAWLNANVPDDGAKS
jgi:hypothetical protein